MPLGLNRSGDFANGNPITLPHTFGNPVTLPKNFGNPVTLPLNVGNPVTWTPSPAHFGNQVGSSGPIGTVGTPVFSPVAGTYTAIQSVTITSANSSAIFYTLDGSTPTTSSTPYTGAITVAVSETIKAIGVAVGWSNSAVGSATYAVSLGPTYVAASGPTVAVAIAPGDYVVVFVSGGSGPGYNDPTDGTANVYTNYRASSNYAGYTTAYTCLATAAAVAVTAAGTVNNIAVAVIANGTGFGNSSGGWGYENPSISVTTSKDNSYVIGYAEMGGGPTFTVTANTLQAQSAYYNGYVGVTCGTQVYPSGTAQPTTVVGGPGVSYCNIVAVEVTTE
jgi:hypothetical protein